MAIRDRLTVYFRDPSAMPIAVEATRQGGSVNYSPPQRGSDFYVLEELNSAAVPEAVRRVEVHKDTIRAIVQDKGLPAKKGRKRSSRDAGVVSSEA